MLWNETRVYLNAQFVMSAARGLSVKSKDVQ